jgi:hypothetical protein
MSVIHVHCHVSLSSEHCILTCTPAVPGPMQLFTPRPLNEEEHAADTSWEVPRFKRQATEQELAVGAAPVLSKSRAAAAAAAAKLLMSLRCAVRVNQGCVGHACVTLAQWASGQWTVEGCRLQATTLWECAGRMAGLRPVDCGGLSPPGHNTILGGSSKAANMHVQHPG